MKKKSEKFYEIEKDRRKEMKRRENQYKSKRDSIKRQRKEKDMQE